MPKYLVQGRYSADAAKGLTREGGTARREAAARVAESLGGSIESFYFAFGEVDVFIICDMPDEASALAVSLAVNQTGLVSVRFIPLVSPETLDTAARMFPAFRPPGK